MNIKSLLDFRPLIFIIAMLGVANVKAANQQILDREITISLVDVPFEKALIEISRAANVRFAYSLDQLNITQNISIEAKEKSLRQVLDEILKPLRIQYKVHDRDAMISLKKADTRDTGQSQRTMSDPLSRITGTITDNNNQPMPGVNIIIRGTTQGTSSDTDGHYTISAEQGDVLVFSFIGYTSVERTVDSKSVIDVVLLEDIKSLNEVVVNAG